MRFNTQKFRAASAKGETAEADCKGLGFPCVWRHVFFTSPAPDADGGAPTTQSGKAAAEGTNPFRAKIVQTSNLGGFRDSDARYDDRLDDTNPLDNPPQSTTYRLPNMSSTPQRVQCFGKKKTATAVAQCKVRGV